MNFFSEIVQNKVLIIAVVAWFIAQALKVIITLLQEKKMDFTRFVGSGGMPSSHSSFSMALTTAIGKMYGWDSPLLAVSLAFALIVMLMQQGEKGSGQTSTSVNKIIHASMKIKNHRRKIKGTHWTYSHRSVHGAVWELS